MKQSTYEAIIKCIKYGAAALADDIINEFNNVVANSNDYIHQKVAAEQAAKKAAEDAKKAETRKAEAIKK